MAIVGVLETGMFAGTINATFSFSAQHNFGPSDIWSRPYLQTVQNNDDDGSVSLHISQFIDSNGVHNGNFTPGIFAQKCRSVTFFMTTTDCIARIVMDTEFFG